MAIGGVVLNFVAKTADAVRDVGKLNRQLDKTGKAGKDAGGKLKGMAKVGVGAVAAGAAVAATALWDMAGAAAEDAEAAKRLEQNLKKSAGATDAQVAAVEDWISQQLLSKAVTDDQLRPALGRLIRSYEDVEGAQEAATLAMDLAAATGKSVVSIAEAIAKAHDGNLGPLKKLGLVTEEEATKGIDWQKKLAEQYKDTAEIQASSAQGALTKLSGIWEEMRETIGAELIDPLTEFSEFLASPQGKTWMTDVSREIGETAAALGDIAAKIDGLVGPFQRLKSATDWLPSNFLVKLLTGGFTEEYGPSFSGNRGGTNKPYTPRKDTTGGAKATSAGVTVNIYNPKRETVSASVAASIRAGKKWGGT